MFFTVGYVTYMVVALLVVLGVAIATKKKIVYSRGGYISHESQLKIEPLKDFDWETTEPLKFRPFKPTYHITMGVRQTSPSELITIDRNYLSRIEARKEAMRDHPDHVLGCVPEGAEPVRELYTYLLRDYLPARFPTMFSLGPKALTNLATGEVVPLEYPAGEPLEALRRLARTVEDDLLLLQQTPEGHRCVALVCTCASGFDPKEKLGRSLRDIHTPVPSYDKIGPSMERYFSRMEVGKNATRVNWSITDSPALLNLSGNHVNEGDVFEKDIDIDITQARFRCELQTVSRLPETRALLFSFKTYTYPLEDIKLEGLGPDLAAAIEGLGAGNAPGMWKYKGGVRWGKSVCKYLRS